MNRAQKAAEYHQKGYNCAQAIVCAFCDKVGLDEKTAFKVSEGLGLGVSDTYGTCGAVTGMANSCGNLEAPTSKAATYQKVRELNEIFRKKNGSTICRELKGMYTGKVLRSCPGSIENAANILSEKLGESYIFIIKLTKNKLFYNFLLQST